MPVTIPVKAIPNQTMQVNLNGQAVELNIYQFAYGLFMDVLVGGVLVVSAAICENLNRIMRSSASAPSYLNFVGDLVWWDTQGSSDPVFTGLGSRFLLIYLFPSDLPAS